MLDVAVKFRRGEFALDVKFSAPTPGVTALFGRSGAGKTTIAQLLAGLLRPISGDITLDGESLFVPAQERRIGYVFQDLRLFPHLNVAGNLRYGQRRAAPPTTPPSAGADPASDAWRHTVELLELGPLLERRVGQLSGGERQRVALGRALLCRPRLLLLDEPLSAVDATARARLLPYLERLRDELDLPMILITHNFDDVLRLANHVVLLDAGRVVAQGALPELSLRSGLRTILGSEANGAVLEGRVDSIDDASGLARVSIGAGQLLLPKAELIVGKRIRAQLLARDLILATTSPQGVSVRNRLRGSITRIETEDTYNLLVTVDVGGASLLARVTTAAAGELDLQVGQKLWVLIKAVSLQGHNFSM